MSEHTKQCGWLRLSAVVQSLSFCLAVPLSFNDNWSIIFSSLFFHFGMKTLIYQTQAAGVVGRGSGRQKWDVSNFFSSYPTFLPPGHVVPDCRYVCVFVCLYVFPSHFLTPFNGLFAPTSRSPMSKLFRYLESLGKSNGKKWSQI